MEVDRSCDRVCSAGGKQGALFSGLGNVVTISVVGFVCVLALSSKSKQSLPARKEESRLCKAVREEPSKFDHPKVVEPKSRWAGVGNVCSVLAIVCALVSGCAWHLSTIGADVSRLHSITSNWNSLGAQFSIASAVLVIIGSFFKKN